MRLQQLLILLLRKVDATGKVTISLTAAQTAAVKAGRYVYDIEIAGHRQKH